MPDWFEIILQLGFPTATVIFLAWKGIPWLELKNEKHNQAIRELINAHEKKMDSKDEKIEKIVQDALENHQSAMRIIEANTRAISSLANDITPLKETNIKMSQQLDKTNELINWLRSDLTKSAG